MKYGLDKKDSIERFGRKLFRVIYLNNFANITKRR